MDETLLSTILERYQNTLEKIADTAFGCGRDPGDVKLVVVSKSQPLEVIQAAVSAGISTFGENYVEEAVEKIHALKDLSIDWHMIGHVQSRKAEMVSRSFSMLHSLDSVKLARRLEHSCQERNQILPVLLEFNVSGEESKFGFPAWDERRWVGLEQDMEQILAFPHLNIRGLMTMPPFFDNPERTRPYFQQLRRLREFLSKRYPKSTWKDLSMGTSGDFVTAIQEGATFVRIGQAILGSRAR
jgi:pyridoxal phosphate enzyme (YggS family)